MAELGKLSLAKLNNSNYSTWKFRMEMLLIREEVWYVIADPKPESPPEKWVKDDRKARATMGLCIEDNQVNLVKDIPSAKEFWEKLRVFHEKTSATSRVSVLGKICDMKLIEGGDMEKHLMELESLFDKLTIAGLVLQPELRVAMIHRSLPESYGGLVTALESRPDSELTVEVVKSKLLDESERRKDRSGLISVDKMATNGYTIAFKIDGNQENLRLKAGHLLPKWCDNVQRETVVDKLEALLINSIHIHNQRRYYMDLERMQNWISGMQLNQHISDLKRSSEECFESGREKYPCIEIDPKRLKELKLYAFLQNAPGCGVYEFGSTFDFNISSRILDQALLLLQHETILVDSTKYTTQEAMMNILDDLLLYLRDVNHSAIKVITILANHSQSMADGVKKLSEKYCQKIIVVVKLAASSQKDDNAERILVQDLSEKASNQLYKQAERMLFGTITLLSSIVEATDDLSILVDVLELCAQSGKLEDKNLNEHNYEQIKHWYVQRHFEPYDYEGNDEENYDDRLINGPSLLHVERALAFNDEVPVAPSCQDGNGGKVCIFLNNTGFGKTTYFTWLAWHLSTSDPSLYLLKITAMEYSTDFDRLKQSDVHNSDDITIVRILYRYVHLALFVQHINSRKIAEIDRDRSNADECAKLLSFDSDKGKLVIEQANKLSTKELIELRLFQQKFNQQKLVLILDGFDEITPYYKDVVMKYFERVARLKGVRSLYLSSRPYGFEAELKNTFTYCQMYRLKPFSNDNIILSLHKFLLKSLDGYKHFKEEHRNDILAKLYSTIRDVLHDVITVPLLLYIVQIILLPEIKKHVSEGTHTISSDMLQNANLDILHLVEQFVERKIKILGTDKTGTSDSAFTTAASKKNEHRLKKEIKEQHMLLAMYVIFDQNDREKLISRKEQRRAIEIMEEVQQGDEKTGIVLGVQNGVPQFLHRMFAEYFTACWFFENWDLFKSESIFHSQTFWSRSLRETREFFDRLILRASKGCDLHLALVNRSHRQIKEILHKDPNAATVRDNVGRLPLHLLHYYSAVGEDINQILNCVSNRNLEFVNQKDKLFEWNALDYIFVSNEGLLIEHLSTIGVKPDMDNLFRQVCSNTVDTLVMQGTEYTYFLVNCIHRNDLVEELSERVAGYLIDVKKIDIYSPRAELNSLSVLEKVVTESNFAMFRQLITKSDAQTLSLGDRADRLLQLSLKKKSNEITYCLVERLPSLTSKINDTKILFFCTKSAIENNCMELFQTLFKKFCFQQKFDCVEEDNFVDEFVDEGRDDTFEIPFENECCFEFSYNSPEVNKEALLSTAIHYGNIRIVSFILQKTNMTVTIELFGKIMQNISTLKYQQLTYNHSKCIPAFQYLFKKIPDLYAIDRKGLNLFHSISKNGCVFMLHSLITIGFDPTRINLITQAEILQQRLNGCNEKSSANIFEYLQQHSYVDFHATLGPIDESIFYKVISKRRFLAAQTLVEGKFRNLSHSGKENAILELLHHLLLKFDVGLILEFAKNLLKESSVEGRIKNDTWHSVYSSIYNQLPVVVFH
ncbi:uncharacterized protein LOC128298777 [Anopheles moucheti]|uniref:uncharacterized protein LOC128298777 n=1 Tax=Anopheles moucheti TaxID=186751 RepID=UPI0022F1293D|nr:uncharacterized protein LOC128298777 [Anopheles moucheti]